MENAVDALIMAGQFLLFLVALSVCMSSFSNLRMQTVEIFGQQETIELSKNDKQYINYMSAAENNSTRVVGAETVVSSMYRAIKENYVIYLKLKDYTGLDGKVILLEDMEIYNPVNKMNEKSDVIKITIGKKEDFVNQRVNEILKGGLYDKIKNCNFYEYLGEYQTGDEGVSSENKLTYRVITYIEKTTP